MFSGTYFRSVLWHLFSFRLMAAQFARPYRKNDKNDRNDAEAICEAVGRPNMRFVPVPTGSGLALKHPSSRASDREAG